MATYYVRKSGSDANNGTAPATAWLTLAKALGASGATSGDTVYVGAGTYRETVTVAAAPTSTLSVIADVDGAQTGDFGPVVWTAYTTSDVASPAAAAPLTLNAKSFLSFTGFQIQGGSSTISCVDASSPNSHDISFTGCTFVPALTNAQTIRYVGAGGAAANWTLDRCVIVGIGSIGVYITLPTVAGADYDANFVIKNCLILPCGTFGVWVDSTGALANLGGGVVVLNTTIFGAGTGFRIVGPNNSTLIPCGLYNSFISFCSGTAVQAASSGQLGEDYNVLHAATARTNVSAGPHSSATFATAPALDWGASMLGGFALRPLFEPRAGSPLLGFGSTGAVAAPAGDIRNRPRPAGGGSASLGIGAFERHDTAAKETSVTQAGSASLKLVGPGDQDFLIPVDAGATTIAVSGRYDTSHGAGSKPQALLLANGALGVAAQTLTMSVGVDTWEALSFAPTTPTAKGWVTLRLTSRAAAGTGIAYWDTITVS